MYVHPFDTLYNCRDPFFFVALSVDGSLEVDGGEIVAPAPGRGGPAALTFRHVPSRLPALADGTNAADEYQNLANPSSAKISQHPVITLREIRLKQIQHPADICRHGEQQGSTPHPTPPRHSVCSHGSNQTL